jgi:hypothetical protein
MSVEGLSVENVVRDENCQILTEFLTDISLVTTILWKALKYLVKIRGVLAGVRTVHLANTVTAWAKSILALMRIPAVSYK